MNDIQSEVKIKEVLLKNISLDKYKVFMFGSRVEGRNRRFSDFDVGILGEQEVKAQVMNKIETELEESDIPYKVDVVDFKKVSEKFRIVALANTKEWKAKS